MLALFFREGGAGRVQLVELGLDTVELRIDTIELGVDTVELGVDTIESFVDASDGRERLLRQGVEPVEPAVHLSEVSIEATGQRGEPLFKPAEHAVHVRQPHLAMVDREGLLEVVEIVRHGLSVAAA